MSIMKICPPRQHKTTAVVIAGVMLAGFVKIPTAHAQNYNNPFPTEPSDSYIQDCANNPATCKLPEGVATGASPEKQEAWNRCLVAMTVAGVPAGRAVQGMLKAIATGVVAGGLNGYASCDWDAILAK